MKLLPIFQTSLVAMAAFALSADGASAAGTPVTAGTLTAGQTLGTTAHPPTKTAVEYRVWYRKDPHGTWEIDGDYSTEAVAQQHALLLHKQGNQVEVRKADAGAPGR